ncbi:TolB-like translocation protein [Saccharolobus islandicus]|uniref:Uncharacterized protein n=1 Tax=Saccharolobus islandicus LAL14/1 TaxID=1241935 RepID=M9U878_SACIS|nr:hypothetical protein [Sulfolobus islandicus]AGJ62293.1 Hypothetical Protein SiL_0838 [Sulfolobus islandicus LAL14/1]
MLLLFTLAVVVLLSLATPFTASISVQYPEEAILGSKISITFSLAQHEVNSTAFPFITSGVREVNEEPLILEGFAGSFAVFKINNSSREVAITFEGKNYTRPCWSPGIVVYGGNFNPHVSDLSQGDFTAVLITFDGRLWVHTPSKGWFTLSCPLPSVAPQRDGWMNSTEFNYTAILQEVNGSICVKYVILNGEKYIVKYQTPIHWNFTYLGVRIDPSTITICGFYASNVTILSPHQP